MMTKRKPFPLQWPVGWPRTTNRHGRGTHSWEAKFETKFTRDRDAVIRQLEKRGDHVVITSNLPTRHDGLPYVSGTDDPGIAVYWVEKGKERVIACDRWKTCALNMRALDMTLVAMRALDRFGASEMVDRAFAGFAALPAGDESTNGSVAWHAVLGITGLYDSQMAKSDLLIVAKARFRERMKVVHPDLSAGDAYEATRLNVAMAAAEKELAP